MTKEYISLLYFWLGLDSQIPNYVKPNSFITQIVTTSMVPFYYHSDSSYLSSPALSYKLTAIVLNGRQKLFHNIHSTPNIPCIKRTPIPHTKYWLKMLDDMRKLRKIIYNIH